MSKQEKITLSMGNIKSVLKVPGAAITLSRDGNIVFYLHRYTRALKIIDISDMQSPEVIGSVNYVSPFNLNLVSGCLAPLLFLRMKKLRL